MEPKELRQQLKRLGMSVAELSAELECHETTIYRWLDGSRPMPAYAAKYIRILQPKAVKA